MLRSSVFICFGFCFFLRVEVNQLLGYLLLKGRTVCSLSCYNYPRNSHDKKYIYSIWSWHKNILMKVLNIVYLLSRSLKMYQCSFYSLETLFYKHTSYYQGIYSVSSNFLFLNFILDIFLISSQDSSSPWCLDPQAICRFLSCPLALTLWFGYTIKFIFCFKTIIVDDLLWTPSSCLFLFRMEVQYSRLGILFTLVCYIIPLLI